MNNYYALILAGGGGTRLWPMSRKNKPKQLLPLVDDHSMFYTAVTRLAPLFSPDRIYVVTGRDYVQDMREDVPDIPAKNFIAEPYGRDNAAATGLALTVIHKRDPKAVVAILTADHHIGKPDLFRRVLKTAYEIASENYIVTLGISPSFPSTGFGYIKQGQQLGETDGFAWHTADRFTEKPDVVRATQFIASGLYSWNSGMFIWRTEQALEEFARQQPEMHQLFAELEPTVDTPDYLTKLDEIWPKMLKKSIDFAIMEGAERMVIIPVEIGWSDVGSWSSLYDLLPQDRFGNCAKGDNVNNRIILDTHNTLVISDRLTVAIGVDNIVVIETDDALLICHKDRTQDVRQITTYLRENGGEKYL